MFQIQVNYREKFCQFYINEISWNCLDGRRQTVWRSLNNVPSICSKPCSHLLWIFQPFYWRLYPYCHHNSLSVHPKYFWSLSTMICPTEKNAHIYLIALRLVWYPANVDWPMTGRCHVKATPSDTNRAYNEWTSYFYIDWWFALRRSALRDSLNGFVSTGVSKALILLKQSLYRKKKIKENHTFIYM